MKTYYSFVYLDDNIIDGLYSQLFGDAVEICTMKEDTTNIDASIKSNLMNIIKSTILGQSKTSISEQEKMVISTSKKAQLLINHLKKEEISIQEIIDKKLMAVDLTASIMCLENKMPMLVFGLNEENSIVETMKGTFTGTKVTV